MSNFHAFPHHVPREQRKEWIHTPGDVGPNPFISTKEVQRTRTTQVDVETDPFISPKMFTTPNQGNPHVMPP